jgi:hypothetical protein
MGAPVVHWEIISRDAARLQEFYSSLFGWSINANNPMQYGLVSTGSKTGIGGGIGAPDPNASSFAAVTFYAEVDDIEGALNKAVSLGATIVVPVTEIPNMVTFCQFRDPDGNVIGMVKSQPPPPKAKRVVKKKAAKKPAKKVAKKSARRRR